jgi:hypothetical protein
VFSCPHMKTKPSISQKIKHSLWGAFLICGLLTITSGCGARKPSSGHILRGAATVTSLGISQNPATGLYELGIKRGQVEVVSIPVWLNTNNNTYAVPDVNSRYEVSTHSAVFGNAALTSTLSTGSNAVNTSVGGATQPINSNVGTGSNLTPLSH